MNPILAFMSFGTSEIIFVLLIAILLFGAKRIPELARSLGQAKREFSKESRVISEIVEEVKKIQ